MHSYPAQILSFIPFGSGEEHSFYYKIDTPTSLKHCQNSKETRRVMNGLFYKLINPGTYVIIALFRTKNNNLLLAFGQIIEVYIYNLKKPIVNMNENK